jgi:hypothetical protein
MTADKLKLDVEIEPDYVSIVNASTGEEIVRWISDEWIEDFEVAESIFNAIKLAYTNPEGLIRLISI